MASTTDTSNGFSDGRKPPSNVIKAPFNGHARKNAREVEIKSLVMGNDRSVFDKIERFFIDNDWVRLMKKGKALQTRQLDTANRDMLQKGITLRIRGECENSNLNRVAEADICVKIEKKGVSAVTAASDALDRSEFEAKIRSFETATLLPLLKKYPKDEHPELHKALRGIKARDLWEHFRIDCIRNRYVVELPESVTGFKDKKFFAELIMDDVAFVMDIEGRDEPLVIARDLEVECEVLFKPCDYDADPERAKAFVSSPELTDAQIDHGLSIMRALLNDASGHKLTANKRSKAQRGFEALDAILDALRPFLTANGRDQGKRLASVFAVNARAPSNDNANPDETARRLHKHLPHSMKHVIEQRPIAQRRSLG